MALPPQAIEKLIHEPGRSQGAYRDLLLFSGALFGITLLVYVGLAFGYQKYLRTSLAKIDKDVKTFSNSISDKDRAELQAFYSQLVNLRTLLAAHTATSPVLTLLENSLQPNVYYTKMTSNTATNQIVLNGAARSLEDAARQAAALQNESMVERVDFNSAGVQASGLWQFTLTVRLKSDIFHTAVVAPVVPAAPAAPLSTSTPT